MGINQLRVRTRKQVKMISLKERTVGLLVFCLLTLDYQQTINHDSAQANSP